MQLEKDAERAELRELQLAQEAEREAKLCVICLDADKDSVLMPCFHACVCGGCAAALVALPGGGLCPVCREGIASSQRFYG
jgi:hypothetical protein